MTTNVNPHRRTDQPDGISSVRFLGMTAIGVALYFAVHLVGMPVRSHPLVLLVVLPVGWFLGVLFARLGIGRPARSRKGRLADSAARCIMIGLIGSGLLFAQILPPTAFEWLALGLGGLLVGAAGHAWARDRRAKPEAIRHG